MRDGFKIGVPHDPGCFFVADGETPEFSSCTTATYSNLRRNGARGGLNDVAPLRLATVRSRGRTEGCSGRLLVRWDVLRDFLVAAQ